MLEQKKLYYEDEIDLNFTLKENDKKLIAFYLPQYHPLDINDRTFGKGFTEWTNVTQGVSRYVGQVQPILPGELGFYDLRIEDNILKQISMAKRHGVYGFCFYYYWFSGEKVMDMPLNTLLKNKDWDFNFSICWVNANWTRRWGDGQANEVIIENKNLKDDPLNFIKDVAHILNDSRYITKEGKPVLSVYSIKNLPDPKKYIQIWRKYFKETFNKDLYIVGTVNSDGSDPREMGFDIGSEFIPMTSMYKGEFFEKHTANLNKLDSEFEGYAIDYEKMVNDESYDDFFKFPTINAISPSWDNEARRRGQADSFSFANSTPDVYGRWLRRLLKKTSATEFIFVNAWNEWAEGAMMEPTLHYGYAVLNETTRAIIDARKK